MAAPKPPSLTRTASLWFGDGASHRPLHVLGADALTLSAAGAGALAGALFVSQLSGGASSRHAPSWSGGDDLALLFDVLIPGLALAALGVTSLVGARQLARALRSADASLPRFGRKCLVTTGCSLCFVFSCVYRALNIADEGAAMCRGAPSPFNAPVAGRFVATLGEVALVVQVSVYVDETARRLGAERGLWRGCFERWTSVPFSTLGPVLVAEAMSWTGVLSGDSKFYCAEYVLWMLIAFTWAWDAAEMLHRSRTAVDAVTSAALLSAGLGLFFFNALLEIPHFFRYEREGALAEVPGIWECVQDADSPLWLKRLPFFFAYFVGCSWSSAALTYRFVRGAKAWKRE